MDIRTSNLRISKGIWVAIIAAIASIISAIILKPNDAIGTAQNFDTTKLQSPLIQMNNQSGANQVGLKNMVNEK